MSLATRRPVSVCGANVNSGFVNTREQAIKTGGELKACVFSGGLAGSQSGFNCVTFTADQVQLASGPGRLKTIICHAGISGTGSYLYDAAAIGLSGLAGPVKSGLPPIAAIPANSFATQLNGSAVIHVDVPFHSGLFANNASGVVGFTAVWTPETNPSDRDGQ